MLNNIFLNEGIHHFYITNNIEESLHNKLNIYIPNKKVNNHNFIISLKNIICNYETPKDKIAPHDYVTKSLIYYSKTIKKININGLITKHSKIWKKK